MQNEPLGRRLGKGANGKKKRPRRCTRAAAVGGPSYWDADAMPLGAILVDGVCIDNPNPMLSSLQRGLHAQSLATTFLSSLIHLDLVSIA